YGSNDLSVMLQGTPGVSTSYDMRGDGITIRGFGADTGDIYRDGIRESGQVRRSTANIERIEILKGPASVLYGRSAGGGVVNMVSKFANFDSKSSVGAYAGSYDNYGT
ncbi:TonB-dependent receptor plug domain-containing protein, partial [Acinetobacter pittii]